MLDMHCPQEGCVAKEAVETFGLLLASGGCSSLAIWDHIAAISYVAMDVSNGASQFASGLRPVMWTSMVP